MILLWLNRNSHVGRVRVRELPIIATRIVFTTHSAQRQRECLTQCHLYASPGPANTNRIRQITTIYYIHNDHQHAKCVCIIRVWDGSRENCMMMSVQGTTRPHLYTPSAYNMDMCGVAFIKNTRAEILCFDLLCLTKSLGFWLALAHRVAVVGVVLICRRAQSPTQQEILYGRCLAWAHFATAQIFECRFAVDFVNILATIDDCNK